MWTKTAPAERPLLQDKAEDENHELRKLLSKIYEAEEYRVQTVNSSPGTLRVSSLSSPYYFASLAHSSPKRTYQPRAHGFVDPTSFRDGGHKRAPYPR
ncbi:hypothetical protein FGIG_06151 [Fasciola gigantica]|uniref:Uncharacterized protein n=1 Tax=Fasciola gigantica TaxID=46835 RepID=A0A504Z5C7_FASGI|nr:hypothetical protein FGIG_06151 [Fasciola gigantica]